MRAVNQILAKTGPTPKLLLDPSAHHEPSENESVLHIFIDTSLSFLFCIIHSSGVSTDNAHNHLFLYARSYTSERFCAHKKPLSQTHSSQRGDNLQMVIKS